MKSAQLPASVALLAFAERLLEGRRTVIFGSASSSLSEICLSRGASFVHVLDPDPVSLASQPAYGGSPKMSCSALGQASHLLRDASFDVALVENLSRFSDPPQLLRQVRSTLGPRGVAIVATPNPDVTTRLFGETHTDGDPIDYFTLYDWVHAEFPSVQMLGQMPFVGYSVAELAENGEPCPLIDAGFVPNGTEEPEWFIALGAKGLIEVESFMIVQVPREQLTTERAQLRLREQLRAARKGEHCAVERLAKVEAELIAARDHVPPEHGVPSLEARITELQRELERREHWIAELEARATTADARADQAEEALEAAQVEREAHAPSSVNERDAERKSVGELHRNLEKLTAERDAERKSVGELHRNLEKLTAERDAERKSVGELHRNLEKLTAERDAERESLARLERELVELRQKPVLTNDDDPAELGDVQRLEAQLLTQGKKLRELARDLRRTEEFGRGLVDQLRLQKEAQASFSTETARGEMAAFEPSHLHQSGSADEWSTSQAEVGQSELELKLDHLARICAEQKGDLVAYAWQNAELTARLDATSEAQTRSVELEKELLTSRQALQELEILIAQLRGA